MIFSLNFTYFNINENNTILLKWACSIGNFQIVKFLISKKAIILTNEKLFSDLYGCKTPIQIASEEGHIDIVKILVKFVENNINNSKFIKYLTIFCFDGYILYNSNNIFLNLFQLYSIYLTIAQSNLFFFLY